MNHVQTLKETRLFRHLSEESLEKLGQVAEETRFPAHSELFREGDNGDAMYVIALGTVRVVKNNKDGSEEEIAVLGTGSYFGEMSFVMDNNLRTATLVAQEDTIALIFDRKRIDDLCTQDAVFAADFYRTLARGLAQRLSAAAMDVAFYKSVVKKGHY